MAYLKSNVTEVKGGRARVERTQTGQGTTSPTEEKALTWVVVARFTQPFALGVISLDTSLTSGSIARPQELIEQPGDG